MPWKVIGTRAVVTSRKLVMVRTGAHSQGRYQVDLVKGNAYLAAETELRPDA